MQGYEGVFTGTNCKHREVLFFRSGFWSLASTVLTRWCFSCHVYRPLRLLLLASSMSCALPDGFAQEQRGKMQTRPSKHPHWQLNSCFRLYLEGLDEKAGGLAFRMSLEEVSHQSLSKAGHLRVQGCCCQSANCHGS